MTIQPFYTHSEYCAAHEVYMQLLQKERYMGLSQNEESEKHIMNERLMLPIPTPNENRNTPSQDMEHDKRQALDNIRQYFDECRKPIECRRFLATVIRGTNSGDGKEV